MKKIHTLDSVKEDELTAALARFQTLNAQGLPQVESNLPSVTVNIEELAHYGSSASPNVEYQPQVQLGPPMQDFAPFNQSVLPENWMYQETEVEENTNETKDLASSVEYYPDKCYEEEIVKEKKESQEENSEEIIELKLTTEDHIAIAKANFAEAKSISEKNATEVSKCIAQINQEINVTVEETKALVAAAERSWMGNLADHIQHLTSLASTITNACIIFASTTKSVTLFIFSNWTGLLLAIVIVYLAVKLTPHLAKLLYKMLKKLFLGVNTGPVLQIPESFYNRLEQINGGANKLILGSIGAFTGVTAVIIRIFKRS